MIAYEIQLRNVIRDKIQDFFFNKIFFFKEKFCSDKFPPPPPNKNFIFSKKIFVSDKILFSGRGENFFENIYLSEKNFFEKKFIGKNFL